MNCNVENYVVNMGASKILTLKIGNYISDRFRVGQNVLYSSSTNITDLNWKRAVNDWYSEVEYTPANYATGFGSV